jgi:hypothetical protein
MVMSATLRVTHDVGIGIELRRGRFDVLVDNKVVGSADNHETIEAPLEPGRHTVRMRKGRYSSKDQSFEAADGDIVDFRGHGVRIWPLYLVSAVAPNLAITLKRE